HRVGHALEFEDLDLQRPALVRLLEGRHRFGFHAGQLRELPARLAQDLHRRRTFRRSRALGSLGAAGSSCRLAGLVRVLAFLCTQWFVPASCVRHGRLPLYLTAWLFSTPPGPVPLGTAP